MPPVRHGTLLHTGALLLFCLVVAAHVDAAPLYHIEQVRDGQYTGVYGFNDSPAPILLTVSLTDSVNVASDRRWPASAVIPPRSNLRLGILYANDSRLASQWKTVSQVTLGDPGATPDSSFVYRLPFPEGVRFRIGQGYDRRTTHQSINSHYAVDFTVPQGTPVLAVRNGVVAEVDLGNVYSGKDPALLSKANRVVILHDDGSLATYAHLQTEAAFVREGQSVTAGQRLALSGNTGYSEGPHLHFVVTANSTQGEYSFPAFFANGNPPENFMFARTGATMAVNYSGRFAEKRLEGWVPQPETALPAIPQPSSLPSVIGARPAPRPQQFLQPQVQSPWPSRTQAPIQPSTPQPRQELRAEIAENLLAPASINPPPDTVFTHLRRSLGRAADASNNIRASLGLGPNAATMVSAGDAEADIDFPFRYLLLLFGGLMCVVVLLKPSRSG